MALLTELLHVTCPLFSAIGLLDEAGCQDLQKQGDDMGVLTWAKLLFAPLFGVVLLLVFFLEEHLLASSASTNSSAALASIPPVLQQQQQEDETSSAAHKRERVRPVKPLRRTTMSPSPTKTSEEDVGVEGANSIRLILVDEAGSTSRYRVAPCTTVKEVVEFYCQRHDTTAAAIRLKHKGELLAVERSLEDVGLHDQTTLDVEVNYKALYEDFCLRRGDALNTLQRSLENERAARVAAEQRAARSERDLKSESDVRAELSTDLETVHAQKGELESQLAKFERDLKTHKEARRTAEQALAQLQKDVAADRDLKEKKRLEKLVAKHKTEVEEAAAVLADAERAANENVRRLEAAEVEIRRLHAVDAVNKQLAEEVADLRSRHTAQTQADDAAKEAAKKAQQELVTWMMKAELFEKKLSAMAQSNAQSVDAPHAQPLGSPTSAIRTTDNSARAAGDAEQWSEDEMGDFASDVSSSRPTKPHPVVPNLSARAVNAARERDLQRQRDRELLQLEEEVAKWRNKAHASEREAKELLKYKAMAKQGLANDKALREVAYWKNRACAFEQEVKHLRMSGASAIAALHFIDQSNLPNDDDPIIHGDAGDSALLNEAVENRMDSPSLICTSVVAAAVDDDTTDQILPLGLRAPTANRRVVYFDDTGVDGVPPNWQSHCNSDDCLADSLASHASLPAPVASQPFFQAGGFFFAGETDVDDPLEGEIAFVSK